MIKNDTDAIRLWTLQLYREHENICRQYDVELSRPVIEVVDVSSFFGKWDAATRSIRIAGRLIGEYDWETVICILKHEMAHQIVSEVFRQRDGHGDLFEKACEILALPVEFRKASGDLQYVHKDIDEKLNGSSRKIVDKVKKLLSLAQSSNENESLSAMKKANELITRYNIDTVRDRKYENITNIIINHKKKRIERYQRLICSILMEFYSVDVVILNQFDAEKCDTYRVIDIIGLPENLKIAQYVYYFLLNNLKVLWENYKRNINHINILKRNSFYTGVLNGFRCKLENTNKYIFKESQINNGKDLIEIHKTDINTYKSKKYPRLYKYSNRNIRVDNISYKHGVDEGRDLVLHRGIVVRENYQGKRITQGENNGI